MEVDRNVFFAYAVKYRLKNGEIRYAINSDNLESCINIMNYFNPGSEFLSRGWLDVENIFHAF